MSADGKLYTSAELCSKVPRWRSGVNFFKFRCSTLVVLLRWSSLAITVCTFLILVRALMKSILSGSFLVNGPHETDEDKCLRALFLTNPSDDRGNYIATHGRRCEGTCAWITSNSTYQSWFNRDSCSHSQLLWISGGPGKGKTMLSIFLSQEVERVTNQFSDGVFLQYYCDNKDPKRNTAIAVLRGLLFQLLQAQPKLYKHILPSFKLQNETLVTSFESLWRCFEAMVCDPDLSNVNCVLDGLDECDAASAEAFLRQLNALHSTDYATCHLSMIVVSRAYPGYIPRHLANCPRIRLDAESDETDENMSSADKALERDVDQFIAIRIGEIADIRGYPHSLRKYVQKTFQERAQGTFLWVGIASKMLEEVDLVEVEDALDTIPPGLDELYSRILLQIAPGRREIVGRILRWVVMAIRPLSLLELAEALDIQPTALFTREGMMKNYVISCGYFLTIRKSRVDLIHQSAKDYLLRQTPDTVHELEDFRIKKTDVNLEIAQKCLSYLQDKAPTGGWDNPNPDYDLSCEEGFPLLAYATRYWFEHAKVLSCRAPIFNLSLPFYAVNSPTREAWWSFLCSQHYRSYPLEKEQSLLHQASFLGVTPLVECLLLGSKWMDRFTRSFLLDSVNKKSGLGGRTALLCATLQGQLVVMRLLLKYGAEANVRDDLERSALHCAAYEGNEAAVAFLLTVPGVYVNAKDFGGRTPLYDAVSHGQLSVVKLFLGNESACWETRNKRGRTLLHQAAALGLEPIVEFLLVTKIRDPNIKDNFGVTPLHEAVLNSHNSVVKLLLKATAIDVNMKDDFYGETALAWAKKSRKENGDEIMQSLLEAGAIE